MKPILCMFGIHKGTNIDERGFAGEWICDRCGKVLHKAIHWSCSPTCEEIMQPVNDVLEPARIVYCVVVNIDGKCKYFKAKVK